MKKLFCSYVISLKLKELGFDEPCFGTYMKDACGSEKPFEYDIDFHTKVEMSTGITPINSEYVNDWISAPLWEQCLDWLLEKHNIFITFQDLTFVDMINDGSGFKYYIDVYGCCEVGLSECPFFDTPYLAREHAILKAIELIYAEQDTNPIN